jgi:tetratricopeptide (TPR) repeat protein
VSELEKFYIESHYYQGTTGELDKARQVYELWAQSYPRDWGRPSAETYVSAMQGQNDKDLIESREELRLNPNGGAYFDLLYAYLKMNRLKEAQSTVEEAEAKKFDSPSIHYLTSFASCRMMRRECLAGDLGYGQAGSGRYVARLGGGYRCLFGEAGTGPGSFPSGSGFGQAGRRAGGGSGA